MRLDKDGTKIYSEQEIIECLKILKNKGVDLDAIPDTQTVGYLFELKEKVRPN